MYVFASLQNNPGFNKKNNKIYCMYIECIACA